MVIKLLLQDQLSRISWMLQQQEVWELWQLAQGIQELVFSFIFVARRKYLSHQEGEEKASHFILLPNADFFSDSGPFQAHPKIPLNLLIKQYSIIGFRSLCLTIQYICVKFMCKELHLKLFFPVGEATFCCVVCLYNLIIQATFVYKNNEWNKTICINLLRLRVILFHNQSII